MKRVKKRTFSGAVCEQEVFYIRENQNIRTAEPREPRFQSEEERAAHREAISRKRHTQLFNANFSHDSLYSTLTMDNDNEVHEYEEMKRLRDNYIRRLKRRFPDAVIFAYIGKGKNTHRLHMHMVSNGIPEDAITGQWKYGSIVRVENLREHNMYDGRDHGEDYTALANYLFDHWTPEQGGHRWKNTRNAIQPDAETPREVKRNYTEQRPPVAPKGYILVETRANKYGYLYFKYVKKPGSRYRKKKDQK
jgi:plasmid stabilization system protein ParE